MKMDKIIVDATLSVGYQKEKVKFLESILENIKFRGNAIKNSIEFLKFTQGGF
mgnify:CR=1 FL=1